MASTAATLQKLQTAENFPACLDGEPFVHVLRTSPSPSLSSPDTAVA